MWKKKWKWNIHTQKKMEAKDSNTNNGNVFMIGTAFLTTWKNSYFVVRRKDKVSFFFYFDSEKIKK